jgi:anti-sigma regulatory factor (Ser/Thr protein kinase)
MGFRLRLEIPSDPRFLSVVRATMDEVGEVHGLSAEECVGVTLAIDEALANVIRHAYENRYDQTIEFECSVNEQQMEFTVLDQGLPPDPARICAQPLDDVALSGRGTHLIKAVMDEVVYRRIPERNQLKLVKRLPGSKVSATEE